MRTPHKTDQISGNEGGSPQRNRLAFGLVARRVAGRRPRPRPAGSPCPRRSRPSSAARSGRRRCRGPRSWASCRSGRSGGPRSAPSRGPRAVRNSRAPVAEDAQVVTRPGVPHSPPAGPAGGAPWPPDPLVVNTHRPCRKWPSTPLTRGSPVAVTVDRARVRMPVSRSHSSRASRVRAGVTMARRCSVAPASEASSSVCSEASSAARLLHPLHHAPTRRRAAVGFRS